MRAAWLCTRDGTRRLTAEEPQDGQYREAASLEERAVDTAVSAVEAAVGATLRGGKKLAQQAAQKQRTEKADGKPEQTVGQATGTDTQPTTVAPGNPEARNTASSPYYNRRNRQRQPTRKPSTPPATQMSAHQAGRADAVNLHQSRLRHDSLARFQVTTRQKAPPRPVPTPKMASSAATRTARAAAAQTKAAKIVQHAKQAARATGKAAQETVKRVADMVMVGLKALWAAAHTIVAAIAAGGTVAVLVVVIICMIALMIGSGFGIFFAAESAGDGMSLADAITQLNVEYQDRLEEIEADYPHDRLEITSNDGSYAIAWQDVLAVFAARTSGAEDGTPVAYLDEANLERLRQIMWDMNEVTWEVKTQTHEVETTPAEEDSGTTTASVSESRGSEETPAATASDTAEPGTDNSDENEDGPGTTTVTETVLILTLHHKTPEEMREEYRFNARQNEYLTLLLAEDTTALWGDLLGGFAMGELGGEPNARLRHHAGWRRAAMAAAGGGHDHLAAGLPHRPDHWRNQLPQRHRHRCARRHPDPGGCRRHRHYRQRPRQLGRQLWLPRQARPRRWIDDTVRALLEHLRHRRPAGQSRAGHCLRRPHRPRDGAASAF